MSFFTGCRELSSSLRSPLRKDNNPSASFYYTANGVLRLHDFGIGFDGDVFDVIRFLYNTSFKEALEIAYHLYEPLERVEVKVTPLKQKNIKAIRVLKRGFNDNDLSFWGQYGIKESTLNYYRVYACACVMIDGTVIANGRPYVYAYHLCDNIYKIYFPFRKEMRFISNGSAIQGYSQLIDGKVLFITKSLKDVMVYYELGYPAIAPSSETSRLDEEMIESLRKRYNRIIVNYDNDKVGIEAMQKIARQYKLEYFYFKEEKDISDNVKAFGIDYVKDRLREMI